jgi:hypothetical protein
VPALLLVFLSHPHSFWLYRKSGILTATRPRQWTECGRRKWNYICHRTTAKCWMVIANGEYTEPASSVHCAITQSSASQISTFSPLVLYLCLYISNWEVRVVRESIANFFG